MIVDSHQHFWSLARGDYSWLTPELDPIYRDHLPEDLAPHLARADVAATVLVQAAPTEDETRFMFDLARETPFVCAVVGWADMEGRDFGDRLEALKADGHGYLKGIRPMVDDITDDTWIASPKLDAAFDAIVALDLRFDALVLAHQLPHLEARLKRTPGLNLVIDHAAKPPIASGESVSWSQALAPLARRTNVYCKLSGLVTEAGPDWQREQIRPYARAILEIFGTERVMWGSDWPVLNLAAEYATWFDLACECLAGFRSRDVDQVLGGNAARFYRLNPEG